MHPKTLALCAVILCAGPPLAHAQAVTDPAAFAQAAGSANMFEVESSQLALDKASRDDVKAFARQMIADHTAAGEKMKAAAAEDGVTPPTAMAAKDQATLETLQGTDGKAFDTAYLDAQATGHDEAVALFQSFSKSGKDSALKTFAAATLPTLEAHQTAVHALAAKD